VNTSALILGRRVLVGIAVLSASIGSSANVLSDDGLDRQLSQVLEQAGFTGTIESKLEERLGRPLNQLQAEIGRNLFFDRLIGVQLDNTCAGCHSPTRGFGDTQSIAIGIDNNNLVGPNRAGPRNQRRTPMILNNAFFPKLMWNSRFSSNSGDPFDNSRGFTFPPPEGSSLSYLPHLLVAQAFIPPTERNEMAGFDFVGTNQDIRDFVVQRLNDTPAYLEMFRRAFELSPSEPITYDHMATAITEFEFSQTYADAPIDRFARGEHGAMTTPEKMGAMLFFGKAGCVACHAVAGSSNEMFSDFTPHVLGVPQVAPAVTNSIFDGPGANEDFGLEQVTGNDADRYKFRTTPLRNVALQAAFFHNGAFTHLDEAILHHLDVTSSALSYKPVGLDADLTGPVGPVLPVLANLDRLVTTPIRLTAEEFNALVAFVGNGLLDERAKPENLVRLIPSQLPSGLAPLEFEIGAPTLVGDIDGDGVVGGLDLALLLGAFGSNDRTADLNGDGIVDAVDLAMLLGGWTA
jgi:cytochrome c peroxidase